MNSMKFSTNELGFGSVHSAEEPNVGRTNVTSGGEGSGDTQAAVNEAINQAPFPLPKDLGPPFNRSQFPQGSTVPDQDSPGLPDPNNEVQPDQDLPNPWELDRPPNPEPPDTTKDLPQLNTRKNVVQKGKEVIRTLNNPVASAAEQSQARQTFGEKGTTGVTAATRGGAYAADAAHLVAHTAANVAPGLAIFGGAFQAATSGYQASKTLPQAKGIDQVLGEIPEGEEYDGVREVAQYASNQTHQRFQHQANKVIGGTLSTAGSVITLASLGHLAPVGGLLGAAGAVLSGGPTKALHYIQKKNTVVKSGAGDYNALGVERSVHAINLRNLLGNTPAGENETDTPKYHAERVVESLGLDPADVRSNPNGQGLVEEKLKSR